jgi:hypothetical protein
VSHLEWTTSEALLNNGGARLANGSNGYGTIPPTSFEMRSGCLAQAATKNWDMPEPELDADNTSKMSTEEPNTSCVVEIEQVCAARFSIEMRTLNLSGEKRSPA